MSLIVCTLYPVPTLHKVWNCNFSSGVSWFTESALTPSKKCEINPDLPPLRDDDE